jgi:hypothetical protein
MTLGVGGKDCGREGGGSRDGGRGGGPAGTGSGSREALELPAESEAAATDVAAGRLERGAKG